MTPNPPPPRLQPLKTPADPPMKATVSLQPLRPTSGSRCVVRDGGRWSVMKRSQREQRFAMKCQVMNTPISWCTGLIEYRNPLYFALVLRNQTKCFHGRTMTTFFRYSYKPVRRLNIISVSWHIFFFRDQKSSL